MRTLVLDVRLDGGAIRVKQATGCADKRTLKEMRTMVRALWRQPQARAIVLDIVTRRRSLLDVYHAYIAGTLEQLAPTVDQDRPLADVVASWLSQSTASPSHVKRLHQVFFGQTELCSVARGTPLLSHLPLLLEDYRDLCARNETPRKFNYAKSGCLALLRDTLKRRHPLYHACADVSGMTERKEGVKPMSVADAKSVRDRLPDPLAGIWWAMCCTGMGPTEYWGEWEVLPDRVRIVGTKRPGRRWGSQGREVPRVIEWVPAVPSTLKVDWFAELLKRAGATPYQARKSFATWLEDAEIPRTRRRLYLGHGAKDVTDLYERREVTAFLAEDAARLRRVLNGADLPPHSWQTDPTRGIIPQSSLVEASASSEVDEQFGPLAQRLEQRTHNP